MSSVKGLAISGGALETQKNYLSIAGLYSWHNTLNRVAVSGGLVQSIGDQSPNGVVLNKSLNQNATYNGNRILIPNTAPIPANRSFRNFNVQNISFLNTGANFAIFGIMRIDFGANTSTTIPRIISTGLSGSGISAQLLINSNTKALTFRLLNPSGTQIMSLNTGANTVPLNETFIYGVVRRSVSGTNNFVFFINNTQYLRQSTVVESTSNANALQYFDTQGTDHTITFGENVIYNWSAFTESQVNDLTLEVRELMTSRLNLFNL